jgi:hypothetical protein
MDARRSGRSLHGLHRGSLITTSPQSVSFILRVVTVRCSILGYMTWGNNAGSMERFDSDICVRNQ